jgi:putative hydrolase of the HAD superfamily
MSTGIVFDLDETLIDRRGSLDIYARLLLERFERFSKVDEGSFLTIFHNVDGNGRVPRDHFFAALSKAAFEGIQPHDISAHFREYAWQSPALFEGVTEFIEELRACGFAIGVVTNGGSHSQNSKIKNSGLDQCIDEFVISEEFGAKKPDPSIYTEIASRLRIEPTRSWFVGDDPISDVVGPSKIGFKTAWIERYLTWPEDHSRCYHRSIAHISELKQELAHDV